METRIYIIRNKKTGAARMVDAPTGAMAMRHVASDTFKLEVGKAKEVALLMEEGVKVEQISTQVQQGDLLQQNMNPPKAA